MFRKLILAALVVPLSACQAGIFPSTVTATPTPAAPTLTPTPDAIVITPPLPPQDPASLPQSEIEGLRYYDQPVRIYEAVFDQNNQGFSLITPTGRPDLALKEYIEPNSKAVVGTRIHEEDLRKIFLFEDNPDKDGLYHGQFNGKKIIFSPDLKAVVDEKGRPIFPLVSANGVGFAALFTDGSNLYFGLTDGNYKIIEKFLILDGANRLDALHSLIRYINRGRVLGNDIINQVAYFEFSGRNFVLYDNQGNQLAYIDYFAYDSQFVIGKAPVEATPTPTVDIKDLLELPQGWDNWPQGWEKNLLEVENPSKLILNINESNMPKIILKEEEKISDVLPKLAKIVGSMNPEIPPDQRINADVITTPEDMIPIQYYNEGPLSINPRIYVTELLPVKVIEGDEAYYLIPAFINMQGEDGKIKRIPLFLLTDPEKVKEFTIDFLSNLGFKGLIEKLTPDANPDKNFIIPIISLEKVDPPELKPLFIPSATIKIYEKWMEEGNYEKIMKILENKEYDNLSNIPLLTGFVDRYKP